MIRGIVAIICAFVWLGIIPVYGSPFGGCEKVGFFTLQLGCSSWPEFIRGFGFVGFMAFIYHRGYRLALLALLLTVVLTSLGGLDSIFIGLHTTVSSIEDLWHLSLVAMPFLYGGVSAFFLYLCYAYKRKVIKI